jgi:hypothetical protein
LCLSFFALCNHALAAGKDYLHSEYVNGGRIVGRSFIESAASQNKTAGGVQYESFDGLGYELHENPGRFVNVLLPGPSDGNPLFTADHVEEMVDRLDLLYAEYAGLLDYEPTGQGLLTIAFIPRTCGAGCGLLGHKGIEITTDAWIIENIVRELDAGRLETILVHEMVHNFDPFSEYLHYLPDHAHAWTDFFEYFAPYRYSRNSLRKNSPDELYDSPIRSVWKKYIADETANWERCVRDRACEDSGLSANNLWAMLYYRVESLHGVGAVLNSFRFLREYAKSHYSPRTELEKENLRILSLAEGVGADISCYMDELKWPVSGSVRNELQKRFGGSGALCPDLDRDGFSLITGDCDDSDAAVHAFNPEVASNGRDDDCDGLVDEQVLVEWELGPGADNFQGKFQTQLPFEATGSSSTINDVDEFQFSLGRSQRVRVTLCANDQFEGWAVALNPDGSFADTANWFTYQSLPGCTSESLDYESSGPGGLSIISDASVGNYSISLSEAVELLPDYSDHLQVRQRPEGGLVLQVDDRDGLLGALGADQIEFWISGAGIRFSRSFPSQPSVVISPSQFPGLADGGQYQVRMRPLANGLPLAVFSAGHAFRYQKYPQVRDIDDRFSGAWFDTAHDGEGFIVEVLENQRALVYWFTYGSNGSQRWMMGVGDVRDNRVEIDDLLDSRGGRFGDAFDPDEVELQRAGSLTLTFSNCAQATANYTVDGVGSHQSLERLTHVFGHECGRLQTPPDSDISGSWFDPSHDGEGFVVQQASADKAVVFWFTYDSKGNQRWMMDTGDIDGSRITFPDMVQPVGGIFGRSFKPDRVTRERWGRLSMELGCAGGKAFYEADMGGYENGRQNLVALTRLANSGCR